MEDSGAGKLVLAIAVCCIVALVFLYFPPDMYSSKGRIQPAFGTVTATPFSASGLLGALVGSRRSSAVARKVPAGGDGDGAAVEYVTTNVTEPIPTGFIAVFAMTRNRLFLREDNLVDMKAKIRTWLRIPSVLDFELAINVCNRDVEIDADSWATLDGVEVKVKVAGAGKE